MFIMCHMDYIYIYIGVRGCPSRVIFSWVRWVLAHFHNYSGRRRGDGWGGGNYIVVML